MEIKVNVQFSATPELSALIEYAVNTLAVSCLQKQPAQKLSDEPAKADEGVMLQAEVKKEDEKPSDKTEERIEKIEEIKVKEEPGKTTYTLDDVRDAMKRLHARFEGEDFKENTTSDLYKKYHKALNDWMKYIAQLYGSERPSELPVEYRKGFIEDCDTTILDEEGKFMVPRLSNNTKAN